MIRRILVSVTNVSEVPTASPSLSLHGPYIVAVMGSRNVKVNGCSVRRFKSVSCHMKSSKSKDTNSFTISRSPKIEVLGFSETTVNQTY